MEFLIIGILVVLVVAAGTILYLRGRETGTSRRSSPTVRTPPRTRTRVEPPPSGLRDRLSKSRSAIGGSLGSLFRTDSDLERWERLEDTLILADVGPTTAAAVVERVQAMKPVDETQLRSALTSVLIDTFDKGDRTLNIDGSPGTVIVVGVNGAGKTTTIAKLASDLVADGLSVVLGAADTFRAAADSQIKVWGDRLGVDVVTGPQGSDPASVAFSTVGAARKANVNVAIIDTAGRLHAHTNLMDELSKIARVVAREAGGISEVLLVLDGSTGQNGIAQAKAFTEAVGVTGAVVTKLDGTAKGGAALAVEHELGIPIKYIGVGEGMDDLIPFDPAEFVEALIN